MSYQGGNPEDRFSHDTAHFPLFFVGLCGPMDGDPSNDLTHSDGTVTDIADVEKKASEDNPEPVPNPDIFSASWM